MSNIELKKYLIQNNHGKYVICIDTGLVFNSIVSGSKYYNLNSFTGIRNSIKNNAKTCRIKNIGKTLWMYYSDFLDLTKEKQFKLLGDTNVTEMFQLHTNSGMEDLVVE